MAKRIQVKGKAPRGLSKATRQIDAAQEALDRSGVHMSVRSPKRSDAELAKIAGLGRGITKPSSTRKKLVKEGNRKFIGPRQFSSELAENRGRGNLNTPPSYRSYHRQLDREILERDDPTVDVHRSNAGRGGQLRGGLSPKVVAKLKAAAKKIATKPASQMTDRERKFIRNIDAMGHYLGNYRD